MITSRDPAELPEACCCDDPLDHIKVGICRRCGGEFDVKCPFCGGLDTAGDDDTEVHEDVLQKVRRLILEADQKRNVRFYLHCMLFAIGDPAAEGRTLKDLAKHWRSTRAVASKYCREIVHKLGIQPSPYMKSELSAESNKRSNKRQLKLRT